MAARLNFASQWGGQKTHPRFAEIDRGEDKSVHKKLGLTRACEKENPEPSNWSSFQILIHFTFHTILKSRIYYMYYTIPTVSCIPRFPIDVKVVQYGLFFDLHE
jgi:hypothetical protein